MSPGRHVPIRTCVGCGGRAPQRQLLCVRGARDGGLEVVACHRRLGRTAYLHSRPECWRQFAARKGPLRSLGRHVERRVRLALVDGLQAVPQVG